MTTILKLENLNYGYEDGGFRRQILKDLFYEFEQGQFYTILGPSGSGKTTLLSIIAGLDKQESGKIYYEGDDLDKIGLYKYRRNKIGIVFQQYNLIPKLNVPENVELPLLYSGVDATERRERAMKSLERVGLADKRKNLPSQLSGGQQQRVSIAQALAGNPSVILADEPTGALDSHTGREVLGMLQQMHDEGHTVVLITHDNSIAVQADRIIRLEDGRVVYDGDAHAPEAVVQPTLLPETPDEEEKA